MIAHLTIVHALSALHAGTGQGSGVIDLPIAREKATGLPYLPGSSLKGTLRTHCGDTRTIDTGAQGQRKINCEQIFGSEHVDGSENIAGSVQISDQRLLLFPVRSLAGTFAWTTSPYVLHRLARDLTDLGISKEMPAPLSLGDDLARCYVVEKAACCIITEKSKGKDQIYLEDLDLVALDPTEQEAFQLAQWAKWLGKLIFPGEAEGAWRDMLSQRLCIVHDDIFDSLLTTATEITARIRLEKQSKTVEQGGLWYEEALPAETILSGLALLTPRPPRRNGEHNGQATLTAEEISQVLKDIIQQPLQLGGKSTVGRGLCRVRMQQEEKYENA